MEQIPVKQKPCAVSWCVAFAVPHSPYCIIHKKNIKYKPQEIKADYHVMRLLSS